MKKFLLFCSLLFVLAIAFNSCKEQQKEQVPDEVIMAPEVNDTATSSIIFNLQDLNSTIFFIENSILIRNTDQEAVSIGYTYTSHVLQTYYLEISNSTYTFNANNDLYKRFYSLTNHSNNMDNIKEVGYQFIGDINKSSMTIIC